MARIQFAFRATGVARAAYEAALRYAQERMQFGRPIAQFQAIRFKLADMATELEAARQLAFYAARRFDEGNRCDLEAGMAKLFATEVAVRAARECLQIHGGVGYTLDLPVQRYLRDARVTTLYEGTSQIQKLIIGREVTGVNAMTPARVEWVEVAAPTTSAAAASAREAASAPAPLEVVCGRATVRVPVDFDAGALARLLDVLEAR